MSKTRRRKRARAARPVGNVIGGFIRNWRQHRGKTLKAVAEACGWSEVHQCRLELHQMPDADEMQRLAAALETEVAALYAAPPAAEVSAS